MVYDGAGGADELGVVHEVGEFDAGLGGATAGGDTCSNVTGIAYCASGGLEGCRLFKLLAYPNFRGQNPEGLKAKTHRSR
jgi:hypothetical protein